MADAVKKKSERSESRNTPEVRIAFPYFHEQRTKNAAGQPLKAPRRDGTFLLPKLHTDPAQDPNYKFLSDLCMEAAARMWPTAGGWPQGGIWPIKDGDVPYTPKPKPGVAPLTAEQIAQKNAWRKGSWVFEASHHLEPGPKVAIVQNGQIVEIPARIVNGVPLYKSGDYGIVHLHAYAYENEQFGVNFGFDGVLFTREGEVIGSGGPRSAAQMFGDVTGLPSSGPFVAPNAAGPSMQTAPAPTPTAIPAPGVSPSSPPTAPAAPPAPPVAVGGAPAGLPPFPAR